jgi:hypothetical protein
MSDRRSNSSSRVTLEDLLRLKRAERPPPEFWVEFEQELRQKQLAALVEKKSWWHEFAAVYSRFGGLRVPVGATAVLAVTLLSVHYYSRSGSEPSVVVRSNVLVQPETQLPRSSPTIAAAVASAAPAAADLPEEPPSAANVQGATLVEATQPVTGEISGLIPRMGDVLENRANPPELISSAHSIAIQFPGSAAMEPELLEAASRSLGFEDRAMPAARVRHIAETLPTATAATEPRHARLVAALGTAFAYSPEPSVPEYAKRSVIRHLTEDGWDHSMSRLEAGANRLSIRF